MTRRLLVLDDDPTIGAMLAMIAESAGFEATFTTEAGEFFRLLGEQAPSHIALDLVMPDMDGVQVMAQLAARRCTAGIIITSGVGNRVLDAARRSAYEHGLNIVGALSKPFTPAAFRDMLTDAEAAARKEAPGGLQELARSARTESGIVPADLEGALVRSEIFLVYQPQVNSRSGEVTGFEALVRWRHPDLGVVMPDRFIPLAEEARLIDALTDRVIDIGLAWLAANFPDSGDEAAANGPEAKTLSVNVSPTSLDKRDFVSALVAACERHKVAPQRVILELTETATMRDPVATLDQLTRMRMKGFQLSIDDFGTGFSSMLQLARLPFSEIKIDKSFVMSAMQSMESRAVVRSIIELGKSFGLRTVAEGVEDASTLEYLRGRGCDILQGYHIARPMPAESIAAWIGARAVLAPESAEAAPSVGPAYDAMPFRWNQDFLTGLETVDQQHRHLVDLVNRFGAALMAGEAISPADVESLFSELVEYAHYHFSEEEDMMASAGLDASHVEFHRDEHAHFVAELLQLRETADPEKQDSLQPALRFLVNWLAYHILGVDQSMARQLAAIREGVPPAEAAARERTGGVSGREPLVDALSALFDLLSQQNRAWREAHRALEDKALNQSEALAQAHRQLEANAMTDPLTGLANRHRAFAALERLWSDAHHELRPVACLIVDANDLEATNLAHGHDAGDLVLCALADCLRETVRPGDVLCRLGGDQFLVVLPATDAAAAEQMGETILRRVSGLRVSLGQSRWNASVRIGIAVRDAGMSNPEELIKAASDALALAKQAGQNSLAMAAPRVIP